MTNTISPNTDSSVTNPVSATDSYRPLFTNDYKVYINHTDAGGIVYHANHLVFFENCRRDWFTQLGLNGYFMKSDQGLIQHFVVSQADLQFKKAILLDEVIKVQIDKVELKPASIIFYQSIHRHLPKDGDEPSESCSSNSDGNQKAKFNTSLLSATKIVIACVENTLIPDSDVNDDNSSDTKHSSVNINPVRPIRVPKNLQYVIQQAILEHKN